MKFQISNGNKLQVRGRVVEKRRRAQEIKESRIVANGNAKSISVNDLLDQHLSKLTLGYCVLSRFKLSYATAQISYHPSTFEGVQIQKGDHCIPYEIYKI